jgi:ribose 5-phosphate isomerase B
MLENKQVSVQDMGDTSEVEMDDYPVFAKAVALTIVEKKAEKGILFCGSGVGMSIVANKFPTIRAGLGFTPAQVTAVRHDDDINILVIPVDFVDGETIDAMVDAFLHTDFSSEEKYTRRIKQIDDIEHLVKSYE